MAGKSKEQGKKSKDTSISVAWIGAGATIIAALIGFFAIWVQSPKNDNTSLNLNATITAEASSTQVAPQPTHTLEPTPTEIPTQAPVSIFQDTFDDNDKKWDVNPYKFTGYSVDINIEGGKLYRIMETNETSNGNFGAIEIPKIDRDDFCLKFDARFAESSSDSAIVIILRANNYDDSEKRSYYYVRLYQDGKGVIRINPPGNDNTLQLRELDKTISWNNETHIITISLQGNDFEIYDNDELLLKTSFTGDEILSGSGAIRLGSEIFVPNEKVIIEFDNVFIYNKCP